MDFIHIARAAEEVTNQTTQTGIAGTFGIDWLKFVGQLVNFGIALFILWKWVFTPVAKKLEERTAKIEKSLNDAGRVEKEKQEFEKWRNEQMVNARHEASVIITKSQTEASQVKDQILSEAKTKQQKLIEQARAQIQDEKHQAVREVKAEMADLVTLATEKILKEKLDGKKDKQLIEESLKSI